MNDERDDRYLWDRSGPVDLEVERLERRLRIHGWSGRPAPDWARLGTREGRARPRMPWLLGLAASAVLAAIGAGLWLGGRTTGPAWQVVALEGAPSIEGRTIGARGELRSGETLSTAAGDRARLTLRELGVVEVGPESRLSLTEAGVESQRMALERGTLRATIFAPPRWFAVDTPAAEAVDLGCVYEIRVEPGGDGRLRVESGWVALVGGGRETFLPGGSSAPILAGRGPGTPVWSDAPERFARAVDRLDRGVAGAERADVLSEALAAARAEDALSVWHLLANGPAGERAEVAERLAELAPPPAGLDRRRVLAGEREALDAWWHELGLGSSSWWRLWRQPSPSLG